MIKKPSAIVWYILLLTIAALLAVFLPPDPVYESELHISATIYRISVLTLIVPYGLIWFSAFYAYGKLDQYADKVRHSREGDAFKKVANGIGFLAWGLALSTILSTIIGAVVARNPHLAPFRALSTSYLALIVSLFSFVAVSRGTRQFDELVHVRPTRIAVQTILLVFTAIGAFYVSIVIHAQDIGHNPYHLPLSILVLTLVIPHMFSWFVGLFSAYELFLYRQRSTGVLYKHALSYFTSGFVIVIISAIAVQFLTGAYINKTNFSLGTVLIEVYGLLIIEATGYALIALAAKRLKRLEEV